MVGGEAPLQERSAAAVLEVVEPGAPHEVVLKPAQVEPAVRVLVDEQRAGVQVLPPAERDESVRRLDGRPRRRRGGRGGRAAGDRVEQQRLVEPTPAVAEPARLRPPPVDHRRRPPRRPRPVGPRFDQRREPADLPLVAVVAAEVRGGEQRPGDQQRRVDGRRLAPPGPPAERLAGGHRQEVVVEPPVPDRRRGRAGRRVVGVAREPPQRPQRAGERVAAGHPSPRRPDGPARQREPDARHAARRAGPPPVAEQPADLVRGVQERRERRPLHAVELGVAQAVVGAVIGSFVGGHGVGYCTGRRPRPEP